MIGAIAGDIIGSVCEFDSIKTKRFDLFSPHCTFADDSVLTRPFTAVVSTGSLNTMNA